MEENKTIHEYQVEFIKGTGHAIKKDGQFAICPFAPPFAAPSPGGMQMTMQRFTCNTGCPHAELATEGEEMVYTITCGGEPKKIKTTPMDSEVRNPLIIT